MNNVDGDTEDNRGSLPLLLRAAINDFRLIAEGIHPETGSPLSRNEMQNVARHAMILYGPHAEVDGD